jgi:hypothetical protein
MIEFELLKEARVLVVRPRSALTADDFRAIARARSIPTVITRTVFSYKTRASNGGRQSSIGP